MTPLVTRFVNLHKISDALHGRRKFRDAEETQPALALEGGAFIGAMYGEEETAQKLGLAGNALLEHRQRHIRPIAKDFERWLKAVEPTLLPSEQLMTAVRYYRMELPRFGGQI